MADEAATPLVVSIVPPIQAPAISCCTAGSDATSGTTFAASQGMR